MTLIAALGGVVVAVGLPWLAAGVWVRRAGGESDPLRVIGLGAAGLGVAAWASWVGALIGGPRPLAVVLVLLAACGLLIVDARRHPPATTDAPAPSSTRGLLALGALCAVLVAVCFLPLGVARGGGVQTLAMTDWYKHLTVTAAVVGAQAFPPPNPYLLPHDTPAYYFGFHLLASAASRLAGLARDPYPTLLVLTLVVAAAMPWTVYAVARTWLSSRVAGLAAVACLLAGFDLLVVGVDALHSLARVWPPALDADTARALVPSTHLDYWVHHNERQLNPPLVSAAWVPQHVAAVLVALAVVAMATSPRPAGRPRAWLLPALALAGLPALSAYVALGLGVGVAVAAVVETTRRRHQPDGLGTLRRWGPIGAGAAVAAAPVLWHLAASSGSGTGLQLGVAAAGDLGNGAVWTALLGERWWARLLDTPLLYLVELGLVGLLAGTDLWRRRAVLAAPEREVWWIVAGIVTLATVVRPPVGSPNNLYARPMLLVFLLLAPFAARAWTETRGRWRHLGLACALGGSAYAVAGMVLQGWLFWAAAAPLADACRVVTRETPAGTSVAVPPERFSRYVGFFCRRPLVVGDRRHAELFGASTGQFDRTADALTAAYASASAEDAAVRFDALGAGVLLVPLDGAAGPPAWLNATCFEERHRNQDWVVATRAPEACGGRGPATGRSPAP